MIDTQHGAAEPTAVRVGVVTVSDTRTLATDEGGPLLQGLAEGAGFQVVAATIVKDDTAAIQALVRAWIDGGRLDAVLLTGGTGLSPRDVTSDAVAALIEKRIDGFGELFRALSFADIGPAAMLSRALAGTAGGVALFVMPGSPAAVRLAMERLIVPSLRHLLGQMRRREPGAVGHAPGEARAHVHGPALGDAHGHGDAHAALHLRGDGRGPVRRRAARGKRAR